jgi:transposase
MIERRWTAWRKAALIAAVRAGSLRIDEVRDRFQLSEDEFAEWQAAYDREGVLGLQLKSLRRRRTAAHGAEPKGAPGSRR